MERASALTPMGPSMKVIGNVTKSMGMASLLVKTDTNMRVSGEKI